MLNHFRTIKVLLLLILFSMPALYVNAQEETDDEKKQYNLSIGFSSIFGGVYYQDPMGSLLFSESIPSEGSIDIDNYELGTNDLISIKIEASQPLFLRGIIVNPQGDITLPVLGNIKVNGLTLKEASIKINEVALKEFKNSTVQITLESPRAPIIHITGGVAHPGKYIVLPQTRVDQAIYSSITSGNRDIRKLTANTSDFLSQSFYSFRSIEIIHKDGSYQEADLINYFRTGDLSSNPFVKDGDLISVRRLNRESPKISISGAVKSDYEFEFKNGDTPRLLLKLGGGFDATADSSKLLIFRRSVSGIQKIEIAESEWDSFKLVPNDRIVAPFGNEFDASASAWVSGEVKVPGNFPIESGKTTAFELLSISGGLTERALPNAAYLVRGGEKNGIPNEFNSELMKRTSDQLIQGLEYLDFETKLSQNKLFIDLNNENQLKELLILDGDRLYVPRDAQTIFVFGQVNNPGYFAFNSANKSVSEYINSAGGFSLSADKDRVFILKAGKSTWYKLEETSLESGDRIFVDRLPVEELNAQRAYIIQREQLKNQRIQLIMTGITTITGIITTYVAIQNIR